MDSAIQPINNKGLRVWRVRYLRCHTGLLLELSFTDLIYSFKDFQDPKICSSACQQILTLHPELSPHCFCSYRACIKWVNLPCIINATYKHYSQVAIIDTWRRIMTLSLYNNILLRSLLTDNLPSPGKVGHTARVYTAFSFQTVVKNPTRTRSVKVMRDSWTYSFSSLSDQD